MYNSPMLNKFAAPVEYLVIGHLSEDLQPDGSVSLGGTAAYAALTAEALGMQAGILTSVGPEAPLEPLEGIPIAGIQAEHSTAFENIQTAEGRLQNVHHEASKLHPYMLPEVWRSPAIVHFAPLLDEIDLDLLRLFSSSMICLTPQGWLREVHGNRRVVPAEWLESSYVLGAAEAAVISIEDAGYDELLVDRLAEESALLVVTEGRSGCRLYERGFLTRIQAPEEIEIDSTGAGDIFAATFFTYLLRTGSPISSARMAVRLASASVRRNLLDSIPTETEIYQTVLDVQPSEFARRTP